MLLKILKDDGAKKTFKMMAIYIGKPLYSDWKVFFFFETGSYNLYVVCTNVFVECLWEGVNVSSLISF